MKARWAFLLVAAAACQKGTDTPKTGSASASASASSSGGGSAVASGGGIASASGGGSASASASGDTGGGAGTASASGGAVAPDDGGPSCKDVIEHEATVMLSQPGIDDQSKQQIAAEKDQAIQQCNAQPPPVEIRKCFMAASSTDGFEKCVQDYAKAHKPPPPPLPPGIRLPTKDDLAAFTKNLKGSGKLTATIETSQGTIHCELFGDKAPLTVANFVGLATGQLAWVDPKSGQAVTGKPFYDGLTFHRVIPDFMIQGGDPMGNGSGGPGYEFADEIVPDLKIDKPGVLAMANAGPDTNGSQFYITEVAKDDLTGHYSVFGQCKEVDVVHTIANVPRDSSDKPNDAVTIKKVTISK